MLVAPSLVAAVLALPVSGLLHPKALAAVPRVGEAGTVEKVTIQVDEKVKLTGSLYSPKPSKQALPTAVVVHDCGGSRVDLKDIAERLQKQGFLVLAVDLRGHGESATEALDWKKLDEAGQKNLWTTALADIKASVNFLRARDNVQAASLSMVGYRSGCSLITRYALRDESVRAIALIDPQPEQGGFNMMKDVEGLGGLPTFVVVGKGDQSSGQRLLDAAARAVRGSGDDVVQVFVSKESSGTTLSDKRVSAEVVKWLGSRVTPQKGRN